MREALRGKKTYLLAAGAAVYAVLGYLLGYQDLDGAMKIFYAAAATAGLRAGITNG